MPTTIDSVTTGDVAPTASPHKINNTPGSNQATVLFTPPAGTIRAWRLTFNGNRKLGRLVGNLGAVCGLDVCGGTRVMPLAATGGVQRTEVVTYAETGPEVDGIYPVEVAAHDDTAWS